MHTYMVFYGWAGANRKIMYREPSCAIAISGIIGGTSDGTERHVER